LQFGLRSMFVATGVVAVMCSLGLATPPGVAVPVFLLLGLGFPGLLAVLIVYGRGSQRTFAIAAIFPAGGLLSTATFMLFYVAVENRCKNWEELFNRFHDMGVGYQVSSAAVILLAMVVGFLGVVVRRLAERRRDASAG